MLIDSEHRFVYDLCYGVNHVTVVGMRMKRWAQCVLCGALLRAEPVVVQLICSLFDV